MHCYLTVQDVTLKQQDMPSYTKFRLLVLISTYVVHGVLPAMSFGLQKTIRLLCWQHCHAYDVEQ